MSFLSFLASKILKPNFSRTILTLPSHLHLGLSHIPQPVFTPLGPIALLKLGEKHKLWSFSFIFFTASWPHLGQPKLISNGCRKFSPWWKGGRGVKLTTHVHLPSAEINMQLYLYSPIALCLIKHRDNLTLTSLCNFLHSLLHTLSDVQMFSVLYLKRPESVFLP
jgi:hypothetical protein